MQKLEVKKLVIMYYNNLFERITERFHEYFKAFLKDPYPYLLVFKNRYIMGTF